jgi:hypothetical protein
MVLNQAKNVLEALSTIKKRREGGFQNQVELHMVSNNNSTITVESICNNLDSIAPKEIIMMVLTHISDNKDINNSTIVRFMNQDVISSTNFDNEVHIYQKNVNNYLLFVNNILNFQEQN